MWLALGFVAVASVAWSAGATGGTQTAAPGKLPPAPATFSLKGDAKNGEAIFIANCASCHGKKGMGNGVVGKALNPLPANFTDSKRMGAVSDWELYNAVGQGGMSVGLSPLMPAWGATLKDQEVRDVLVYVKHFWTSKSE
jgi:mono/diheme cytochrome c family protein